MKFWEISDLFWEEVKPLIPEKAREPGRVYQRLAGGGRKPLEPRKVFSAIVYVLKTGIQWKALPKEWYGSPSSIHAYFKKWEKQGLFGELWKRGLAEFEEMKGIAWEWTFDTTLGVRGASGDSGKVKSEHGNIAGACHTWRPVINRRSRESAKSLCDRATILFTDTLKS